MQPRAATSTSTSSPRPAKVEVDSHSPISSCPLVSLPAEIKLQIFLASLDRLSIEALARSCKAFYWVFYLNEPQIWKTERQVWLTQKDTVHPLHWYLHEIARDEFDFDKKLRELEKADPEGLGKVLRQRKLRRKRTNELLQSGYGRD